MAGYVRKRLDNAGQVRGWQARYTDPADSTKRIERTFKLKADAEAWLSRQAVATLDGTHVDPRRGERPLSEIADAWRETWTDLEPKTRAGYEALLRAHVIPKFGGMKVGAVSPEVVQRWVNDLARTRKPNTVRRIYGVLRAVLRVAVERRYLAVNPCDSVKLPKKGRTRERQLFLDPAEVRLLADAPAPKDKSKRAFRESERVAILVAAYCGLRAGELWALRRRDIDLLHGRLTVERALKEINSSADSMAADKGLLFGPTKTHQTRTLTIPGPLRTILADHLAQPSPGGMGPDDLAFTSPKGKPVRHNVWYKRTFKPAVVAALPERLHRLRFHDLRHTCASLSLAVTPNLHVVKERLGHEDIRTTINIYGHLLPSVDAALADGLGAMFDAAEAPSNVRALR